MYFADKNAEGVEVTVTDGLFTVEHNTGYYQILIHAEDAYGNFKEYTFNVEATGPSELVDGKILYPVLKTTLLPAQRSMRSLLRLRME